MTNQPIPEAAWPAVEKIRREVPRPETLPKPNDAGRMFRWKKLDDYGYEDDFCPLGLCPDAHSAVPSEEIGGLTKESIRKFWTWWERQTDAQFAVDQTWGPKEEDDQ